MAGRVRASFSNLFVHMQTRNLSLLVFGIAALLASCTKPHDLASESTYSFTNQTGKRVTFDLYPSKADYGMNTNRLERLVFEPNSTQKLKLRVGQEYWVDWYSDSYGYNNWELNSNNTSVRPELKVADVDDSRVLSATYHDTTRSIMLNGSATSSRWKGVVANGSAVDGTHEFVFQKDFTGLHTFTSTGGQTTVEQFTYRTYTISRDAYTTYFFSFYIDRNGLGIYRASCNLKSTTPLTGRDSLYITPISTGGGSSTNFFVKRQ
jgi:hypothetical protein